MTSLNMQSLQEQLTTAQNAARALQDLPEDTIAGVLCDIAQALEENGEMILEANTKDLDKKNPGDPTYDRLLLSQERLGDIGREMRAVAKLPSPVGTLLEERVIADGLHLQKISVPLGVIGIIYEARPNVTCDVFALCFKSRNVCVLKGGSDAEESNRALVNLIQQTLIAHAIDPAIVVLLPNDKNIVQDMLTANELIDVIIPRGSQELINFVREHATVPVIETGAGIVHTYIDKTADSEMAQRIVFNAKTRRPSVCNALDTILIHVDRLPDLPVVVQPLADKQVEIFADDAAYTALEKHYPKHLLHHAESAHFGTEFLSLKLSIKTVRGLDDAIAHINRHGSKHSEAIVSRDVHTIEEFLRRVDAATVYANTSTAYTDGAQFGLGAEIGISTQKLHARGPMGLRELTSYKYIVRGNGQTRA